MPADATPGSISAPGPHGRATGSLPVRAPDLAELETLVACAAEGSLVAAGERLGISRPAVTKRIGNLEALAGRPLLHRGGRGVRLTDAGATLIAGARRLLDERDELFGLLTQIRGEDPSQIAGLRGLLGHSPALSRAAQQPEARLTETERMLELVLRESSTAVVISDPESSVVHEVNEAFCRLTGRSREELLGQPAADSWYSVHERERLVDEVGRTGRAERVVVQVQRPDGTLRIGEASARFVALAGTRLLLSTVDDITDRHRLKSERESVGAAQQALGRLAALLLAGRPVIDSVGEILGELRRSGGFTTALVWDGAAARPLIVDGDPPPPELERQLRRGGPVSPGGVVHLAPQRRVEGSVTGWAAPLAEERWVILACSSAEPGCCPAVFADVLAGLAAMVDASVSRTSA
jgi:PAS domain S-box-containing protein